MRPPFEITGPVLALCSEIERLVGRAEGIQGPTPQPLLRKRNRVRTIQGSVAIEGNTLSEEQVTALLDGTRVIGSRREILEVTNANEAYERVERFRATSEKDLLTAHRLLMKGLLDRAGRYRTGEVGVLRGKRIAHMAPPAHLVAGQTRALLRWLKDPSTSALVRSCVAHYELLFIHPFVDGNGRLARLWQAVLLREASSVFQFVPVESVIRERKAKYYAALSRSDRKGNSTGFVEFALEALRDAVAATFDALAPARHTRGTRLEVARAHFGRSWFSRGHYLKLQKAISTATASRDLLEGAANGVLDKRGERRVTEYRFSRHAPA